MAALSKTDLVKLQKQLKTDSAIGKKVGVTRQAIHQLRKKYGIESRLVENEARNSKILDLYKSGKTGTFIAEKLGLSAPQTYRIISTIGGAAMKKDKRKKGAKSSSKK